MDLVYISPREGILATHAHMPIYLNKHTDAHICTHVHVHSRHTLYSFLQLTLLLDWESWGLAHMNPCVWVWVFRGLWILFSLLLLQTLVFAVCGTVCVTKGRIAESE